ncbi:MAG: acyl-CoA dehydrogenase family protein [Pseudomonadales bacterium]|jgi:alkylation response protein AidB-like acyl-CoA dehydrogenase|tara:strand:- start:11588 stop:12775 length:1188 start_codon:yes stop_codon:yes gene_type:complete
MPLENFRTQVSEWLAEHCPESARGKGEIVTIGSKRPMKDPSLLQWRHSLGAKGWTVPTWPKEYGGGGLDNDEAGILYEELARISARLPMHGMGVSMIGPTLLEYGTEEQKKLHIPGIASGDVSWCQGYSEPGAGSDLASLRTKAEDKGDFFEVNGQKIWTSGAQFADWIFALVRTDFDVPKHEGISFVLMDMSQAGVSIKPIKLISGSSPFCETFFDNAIAQKTDLVGQLNRGWTVGKRLLQHERSGQGGLGQAGARRVVPEPKLAEVAKQYVGVDSTGKIADSQARREVTQFAMDRASFKLTQKRAREENESGQTMGEATSIFKLVGASWSRDTSDLLCKLRGSQGYGWEGEGFDKKEIESTRDFLSARAHTIYGGTNEVQLNIIAKRVLGLPE